jgi:hypothetical protein
MELIYYKNNILTKKSQNSTHKERERERESKSLPPQDLPYKV